MPKLIPIQFTGAGISGPTIFKNRFLNLDGKSGLVFDGLTFTESGQIFGKDASHITFVNCRFLFLNPMNEHFVQLWPGNNFWLFSKCSFEFCGDAIYANCIGDKGGEYLTVEDCFFNKIGTHPEHKSKDGHCVGWQLWKHVTIRNCMSLDTGTAWCGWSPGNQPLTDVLIEKTTSYGVRKSPWMQTNGDGVNLSGTHPLGLRKNLTVRNFKVYDAAGYGLSSNSDAVITGRETNEYHDCKAGNERINGVVV